MAGDEKETSAVSVAAPIVDDPFPSIAAKLQAIHEELAGIGLGEYRFGPTGALDAGSSWQRLRCRHLVFSTSLAATVTLTLGTVRWSWTISAGDTRVIPFTSLIERGTDVTLTASAGVVTGNLVARPE